MYIELNLYLRKINTAWRQIISEELKNTRVTYNDREILQLIDQHPGTSKKYLSDELSGGYQQNITRSLNRLESLNYLEKKVDTNDRRSFRYYLKPEGKKILNRLEVLVNKVWRQKLASFSEKDIQQLKTMLSIMAANIHDN